MKPHGHGTVLCIEHLGFTIHLHAQPENLVGVRTCMTLWRGCCQVRLASAVTAAMMAMVVMKTNMTAVKIENYVNTIADDDANNK